MIPGNVLREKARVDAVVANENVVLEREFPAPQTRREGLLGDTQRREELLEALRQDVTIASGKIS